MNYAEALQYVNAFINYEKTVAYAYPEAFKLDRMRSLAKALGNPQNAYDSVLIAGSKGKGSTAALLGSILRMENLRVGLYTSPHLLDIRERIAVNGVPVGEARFIELALEIRRVLDDSEWRRDPPTFFEVLTAMAFLYFKQIKVQVAVLEVGLGGLYDSTNIVKAKVAGITPISLEHTEKLGKTVAKIAVQKAGIIKGREIVVSAAQPADAENVIQRMAEDKEAQVLRLGKEIRITEREHDTGSQRFDVRTPYGNFYDLELTLLGRHQIENAALALTLAKSLEKKSRLQISESAIRQGIRGVYWPGRLEKVEDSPSLVLDGAHNVDSVKKTVLALHRHFSYDKLWVVLGISADKDVDGILEQLMPEASGMTLTQSDSPRALPARELASHAEAFHKTVRVEPLAAEALEKTRVLAGPNDLILVTGSLFLVADIKKALNGSIV